jgi:hypothetical protein
MPIEGDRWLVTLVDRHADRPTADPDAFLRHADSFPHPSIAALIRTAEPASGISTFQFPASRRRQFERLRNESS